MRMQPAMRRPWLSACGPRCAAPQTDAFCKQLGPLVAKLNEDIPDMKHDVKGLGLTVGQMLQFQEDALGANVSEPERRRLRRRVRCDGRATRAAAGSSGLPRHVHGSMQAAGHAPTQPSV